MVLCRHDGKTVTGAQLSMDNTSTLMQTEAKLRVVLIECRWYSKYDAATGEQRLTNEFFTTGDNNWYYIGANGNR